MYALRVILLLIVGAVAGIAAGKQGNCTKFGPNGAYDRTHHILDTNIGVGDPTTIHCTLDQYSNYSVKQLSWIVNGSTVAAPKVSEMDDKTLVLNLDQFQINDSGSYRCSVKGIRGIGMCILKVNVGRPPIPVENFSCLSHNWEYMDCTWKLPYNPIKTNYSLIFHVAGQVTSKPCNLTNRGSNQRGTNLTKTGEPFYNMYMKHFNFVLTGTNTLGKQKWNYSFNHLSRVKPNAPSKLSGSGISNRSAEITWDPPKGLPKDFHPNLMYMVRYRSNFDSMERTLMENRTAVLLKDLIPHARYDVSVSCITVAANQSDPVLWSPVSTINFTTLSDVPGSPPEVTDGSFHLSCVLNRCSVTVYWKTISREQWHGENFTYDVVAVPLDTQENAATILPATEVTRGSALVENLVASRPYRLMLYSKNEIGMSVKPSELLFYAKEELLQRPTSIVVTGFSQTLYELSWTPPPNATAVTGYKLFVFGSPTPFIKSPDGAMYWESVDRTTLRWNVSVTDPGPFYSFGVVAIGSDRYSDIEWNTCIVYFNGTIGKMKKVDLFSSDATSVTIKWCLDCAEKKGIITGYNIQYCHTLRENDTNCMGPVKNHTMEGALLDTFLISGLTPNSCYQVSVSAVTRAGLGEYSDPRFYWTSEAAPGRPEPAVVTDVTNSSFRVSWNAPFESNGCITKYNVHYFSGSCGEVIHVVNVSGCDAKTLEDYSENITFKVFPYSNYSVTVQACTLAGCSRKSEPVVAFTEIGVPDQMEPPLLRTLNDTHLLVQPNMRHEINGPSLVWDLEVIEIGSGNSTNTRIAMVNITTNMTYITVPCAVDEAVRRATSGEAGANHTQVRTRAVNSLTDGQRLEGPWSDFADVHCLLPDYSVYEIVGFAIAATIGMLVVGCVAVYIFKEGKIYWIKLTSFKVILPPGIDADNNEKCENLRQIDITLRQQKKDHSCSRSDIICNSIPTSKLLKDDERSRNVSGDTTRSNCSTDELLHCRNWANSSVASGTQDSTSSRPSTATTNVSTDSSMELASSIPESPDSVFTEHPLKNAAVPASATSTNVPLAAAVLFNPTLRPIGESLDGGSGSGTPRHYSRFAEYYKRDQEGDDHMQAPTSPQAATSNGYVAAPYSKFALGVPGGSEAPWRHTVADFDDLNRHRQAAPEYENSPASPPPVLASSYSKFGAGNAAYPLPLTFDKVDPSVHPIPATSTPTRLSPGYSVFGVNDGPEDGQGASKGYVLAAAFNNPSFASNDVASKSQFTPSPATSYVYDDEDDADDPGSVAIDLSGHKRSPSNVSSLTAGYCRMALSRPTSMGSDGGQYVASDPASVPPTNLPNSPAKGAEAAGGSSGLRSPSIDIPSVVYQNGFTEAADDVGESTGGAEMSSGYATMQQILGSDGNS